MMEIIIGIVGAILLFGGLIWWQQRSKAKNKPYRIDYTPVRKILNYEIDMINDDLLREHRELVGKEVLIPEQMLFEMAKKHCQFMFEHGRASHDNKKMRVHEMVTHGAIKTGEVVADGLRDVESTFFAYLNHKDLLGRYTHRKIIEGDYTHYGHCVMYGDKLYSVMLFWKHKK